MGKSEAKTKKVSVAKDAVQRVARRSARVEKQTIQKRVGEIEKAIQRELKRFLKLGLWMKFENSVNTSKADDRYFKWYQALDGIGNGALTHALKKMEILHVEHCTRDAFEEYRDEHGTKDS